MDENTLTVQTQKATLFVTFFVLSRQTMLVTVAAPLCFPTHPALFLLTCLLWVFPAQSHAGNILVYPVDGSHWLNMDILLRELHQRGHSLTVVRSSTSWYVPEHAPHYSSVTVPVPGASNLEDPQYMAYFLKRSLEIWTRERSILSFIKLKKPLICWRWTHRCSAEMAHLAMEEKQLMEKLKAANFDLILTDPGFAGGVVLGSYLGLPFVLNVRWDTNAEGHFATAPSPLSYIPTIGSLVTDKMSFANKLKNFLHYGIALYIDYGITRPLNQGSDQLINRSKHQYLFSHLGG